MGAEEVGKRKDPTCKVRFIQTEEWHLISPLERSPLFREALSRARSAGSSLELAHLVQALLGRGAGDHMYPEQAMKQIHL